MDRRNHVDHRHDFVEDAEEHDRANAIRMRYRVVLTRSMARHRGLVSLCVACVDMPIG